jgi:zinc protease
MKRLLPAAAFLAVLILATVASGAEKLPEMKFEKYELPNGLDVILYEDHSLPTVAVNIWYHVGSKNEKRGRTGFAHLFEHMMFGGSEHLPGGFATDSIGGTNNASTTEDRTNYWETVPSNYLERALWMESDRMGFLLPAVTDKEFTTQQAVVKNERRERIDNQPYAKADELISTAIFPSEHPYSWSVMGSMEDLTAAKLEDVKGFFRTYYTPNNASLCIAGDFDPAQAKALVEKYFGTIPAGPPVDRLETWIPSLDGVRRIVAEDRVSLPRLYMVWPCPPDFAPGDAELDLFSDILAPSKNSRLYKTLVYEKQIAQDVSAFLDSHEIASLFIVEVTAREGHALDEIEREVDAVLREVLQRGITAEELSRIQAVNASNFVRALQRVGGFGSISDRANNYNTFLGEPNRFQWDLDRYEKTTAADVDKYARQYLDLNRRVILHIVPQGDLKAAGADFDRSRAPAPTAEPSFTPPAIQKASLSNGATLLLVEKHDLPLVQVNMYLKSGWAADPADKPGSAALTAELLDEGTKTRSSLQISDEAERLGAMLRSGSTFDGSNVALFILKSKLDRALPLMSDVILNPTFPAEELERQRQIYLGRIAQENRQPMTLAIKTFGRLLYGAGHPYAQPPTGSGTPKSIGAVTRDDLLSFYRKHYLPNNAAFVVVGDITLDEAKGKLEKAFAAWKPGSVSPSDIPAAPPLTSTHIFIVDMPKAAQSAIVIGNIGIKRSDPDFVPCQVTSNGLGGGGIARLYLNLREDKGYTYGAYSSFAARRAPGPFIAYAEVQTPATDKAVTEFMKELRDIGSSRPLADSELVASKDDLIKGFPQDFETYGGLMGRLGTLYLQDLPLDDWRTYTSRVSQVTRDVATRAAKDHIRPDALLIVIVGDREKIEPALQKLNLGEVTVVNPENL